jgi:hypothetical protein
LATAGRTNANCWAVDLFFMNAAECWEKDWAERGLPGDFHEVFALMSEALHDSVAFPSIAEDFDSLPEQLLERVRKLDVG